MPDDIENFGGCCRRLHLLAKPWLREHRGWKGTKSYLELDAYQDYDGMSPVISELCNFAKTPRIALYRTHISYEAPYDNDVDIDHMRYPETLDNDSTNRYIDDDNTHDSILAMVSRSMFTEKAQRRLWCSNILAGKQNPAFTLLLMFLPNLRKLVLDCSSFGRISLRMLENFIRKTIDGEGSQPLGKLLEVGLHCTNLEESERIGSFGILALFARLPSLRRLHGSLLKGAEIDEETWPAGISQVTEIDIAYSSIDGVYFSSFDRGFATYGRSH